MARVSDSHDRMILNLISPIITGGGQKDSFLAAVKAHLDSNYATFKQDGQYTVPHVLAAVATLMNKTK